MLYLAGELYKAATNASLGLDGTSKRSKHLLSFEIEPAGEPKVTPGRGWQGILEQFTGTKTAQDNSCQQLRPAMTAEKV